MHNHRANRNFVQCKISNITAKTKMNSEQLTSNGARLTQQILQTEVFIKCDSEGRQLTPKIIPSPLMDRRHSRHRHIIRRTASTRVARHRLDRFDPRTHVSCLVADLLDGLDALTDDVVL